MNDEIKEILEDLRTYKDKYEYFLFNNLSFSDRDYKAKILLDYITNLQEENKRLSIELNTCMIERNNYLSRRDKALEILGNYKHYCVPDELSNRENEDLVDEVYMVLRGENNE